MSEKIDYAALLERIQSGDRSAESALVGIFWRGLYFILYRQTSDQDLSRDLAQDALLVVISKAREGLIDHPHALSSYIRKVGENLLIGFRRKQKRQNTDTSSEVVDRVADEKGSLLASVRENQIESYVRTILSELSQQRDQDILRRHYLLGEEKEVICSALNLTHSQADTVLHRARTRLKELILRKETDGSGPPAVDLLSFLLIISVGFLQNASRSFVLFRVKEYVLQPHLHMQGGLHTGVRALSRLPKGLVY